MKKSEKQCKNLTFFILLRIFIYHAIILIDSKGEKSMLSKGLAVGIIVLFIASAVIPMTFGYNIRNTHNTSVAEKYIFDRYLYPEYYNYYNASEILDHITTNKFEESTNYYDVKSVRLSKSLQSPQPLDGPMNSPWPVQCHDTHHTGRSSHSTANNPGVEKWRFECDWVEGTPIVDSNGTISFGSCDRYIYALYLDGTLKWKYKLGDNILGSSPAISQDGTIYVGSWDGKLYAINSNGILRWKFSSGDIIPSSPVIADDGTIYFGTESDKIYAVNPDGTEKWHYTTGDWITSDPAIGDDGTVYIGSMDYYLYALYSNGTLRWRFNVGDRIYGSPSIADDGTIYIGSSWDSYLYALYPNGTLKWKYAGAGTPNNPSIGSDGTIYAGYLYNLIALHPNGTLKWDFYVGNNRFIGKSSPAISADGTIYFGIHLGTPGNSNGGEIIAVNPDGTEKWRKRIANEWVESSPSIADDGTVYVGSSYDMGGGYLHAFGTVESNEPPSAPIITGPTSGNAGESYTYTFISSDPESYPLKYYVDWGDNTNTGWTEEYDSGQDVEISHTWSEQGTYMIKAKAMDISNYESDWGTLSVTMPLDLQINQHSSNQLFIKMLQRLLPNIR